MRVTHAQFQEAIDARIRDLTGQEEDPSFVMTLRNYVLGLVKHHGAEDSAQLHRHLREFLEGKTAPFVDWCGHMIDANTSQPCSHLQSAEGMITSQTAQPTSTEIHHNSASTRRAVRFAG